MESSRVLLVWNKDRRNSFDWFRFDRFQSVSLSQLTQTNAMTKYLKFHLNMAEFYLVTYFYKLDNSLSLDPFYYLWTLNIIRHLKEFLYQKYKTDLYVIQQNHSSLTICRLVCCLKENIKIWENLHKDYLNHYHM